MTNTGCLIIHGFAGNRQELSTLSTFLEEKGFIVSTPLLAGHEGTRRDLSRARYSDWIESAKLELVKLAKKCDKVYVIGHSMGGLIAVNLYKEFQYDGLVFINTPIYYWSTRRIIKNVYHDYRTFIRKYFVSSTNKAYRALIQFLLLLNKTKPLFKQIMTPTLIIQTLDDDVVNPKSADFILNELSGEKMAKKYPVGGHVVFESATTTEIYKEILCLCQGTLAFR